MPAAPHETAEERVRELEFLLRLNREADDLLEACNGEGVPLDEAVQRFLDVMAPRAGAVAGAARISVAERQSLIKCYGLELNEARDLLRGARRKSDEVASRYALEVGKVLLGELVLVFPASIARRAYDRTQILAEQLDGAVFSLAEAEQKRSLREKLKTVGAPGFSEDGEFGRYTLLRQLGQGGMAQVHLARVDGPGGVTRLTALKRMLPHLTRDQHLVSMFLDEAKLASLISHPHVARVEDFGELAGTYFMAMEFLPGVDGARLVDDTVGHGGIPISYAVALASQVAMGLHAAHELCDLEGRPLGIIHRDVSPQNVLITFDGVAKLVDFGVAKSLVQREQTRETAVKGKLCYMSPEQCSGKPIDRRSDVFALGAVLHEMLGGRPTFLRMNDGATLKALLEEPIPSLQRLRPDVDEELWRIVQRALARKLEDRYATGLHFSAALDGYLKARGAMPSSSEIGRWLRDTFPGRAEEIASWTGALHRQATRILPAGAEG